MNSGRRPTPGRESLIWLGLIFALWLAFFWPFVTGSRCFAFRDTAHFYYPLFSWIDQQAVRGQSPAWNPYDNFGMPLAADAGTCAYYPLKLIFLLRDLPFSTRFGMFVSLHVLMAAYGAYWAARKMPTSPSCAALAAFAYSFGGVTLSQTCNLVYLIGIAWMPWLFGCLFQLIRAESRAGLADTVGQKSTASVPTMLFAAGSIIALMVVGGDAQAAYHAALMLAVAAWITWRKTSKGKTLFAASRRCLQMTTVLIWAIGLSAVAWLPVSQWNRRSERAYHESPRSAWELVCNGPNVSKVKAFVETAVFGEPPGANAQDIYQFSQPPWTLAELAFPNCFGTLFPLHRRWDAAFPAADRVWNPSIYMGLSTLLLLLGGIAASIRRPPKLAGHCTQQAYSSLLIRCAIVFLLGSFGWYGVGWIARELGHATGAMHSSWIAPQTGGMYWLMSMVLPLYCQFRYPAKLFAVAALALALYAAKLLDQLDLRSARRLQLAATASLTTSVLALLLSLILPLHTWCQEIPADPAFGPFDVPGAIGVLRFSLIHAAIVSSSLWGLMQIYRIRAKSIRLIQTSIVVITVGELLIANGWLVPSVDRNVLDCDVQRFTRQANLDVTRTLDRWSRAYGDQGFASARSTDRLAEIVRVQRDVHFPKFNLGTGTGVSPSFNSIEAQDIAWFNEWLRSNPANVSRVELLTRMIDHDTASLPVAFFLDRLDDNPIRHKAGLQPQDRTAFIEMLDSDLAHLEEISPEGKQASTGHEYVRADQSFASKHVGQAISPGAALSITLVQNSNTDSVFDLHIVEPGWFVRGDYWDSGWRCANYDQNHRSISSLPILRFAGIFRAVKLQEPGETRIEFHYVPPGLTIGWWISVVTALVGGIVLVWFRRENVKSMWDAAGCQADSAMEV